MGPRQFQAQNIYCLRRDKFEDDLSFSFALSEDMIKLLSAGIVIDFPQRTIYQRINWFWTLKCIFCGFYISIGLLKEAFLSKSTSEDIRKKSKNNSDRLPGLLSVHYSSKACQLKDELLRRDSFNEQDQTQLKSCTGKAGVQEDFVLISMQGDDCSYKVGTLTTKVQILFPLCQGRWKILHRIIQELGLFPLKINK